MPPSSTTRKGRPPAAEESIRVNMILNRSTLDRLHEIRQWNDLDSLSATVRYLARTHAEETAHKGRKVTR